jgi:hypothetical protein
MKNGQAKRKEPSTQAAAKPSRDTSTGARGEKEARRVAPEQPRPEAPKHEQPRPAAASPSGELPIPDLAKYGISESEARAHLRTCQTCGVAHRHVVKNPKDVMALDSFGRRIASCVAVQGDKQHA